MLFILIANITLKYIILFYICCTFWKIRVLVLMNLSKKMSINRSKNIWIGSSKDCPKFTQAKL